MRAAAVGAPGDVAVTSWSGSLSGWPSSTLTTFGSRASSSASATETSTVRTLALPAVSPGSVRGGPSATSSESCTNALTRARGGALSEPRSIRRGSWRLPTGTAPSARSGATCSATAFVTATAQACSARSAFTSSLPLAIMRSFGCTLALTRAGLLRGIRPLLGRGTWGAAPSRP